MIVTFAPGSPARLLSNPEFPELPTVPVALPTGPTASHIQRIGVLEHSPYCVYLTISIEALSPESPPVPELDLGTLGPLAEPVITGALDQPSVDR